MKKLFDAVRLAFTYGCVCQWFRLKWLRSNLKETQRKRSRMTATLGAGGTHSAVWPILRESWAWLWNWRLIFRMIQHWTGGWVNPSNALWYRLISSRRTRKDFPSYQKRTSQSSTNSSTKKCRLWSPAPCTTSITRITSSMSITCGR